MAEIQKPVDPKLVEAKRITEEYVQEVGVEKNSKKVDAGILAVLGATSALALYPMYTHLHDGMLKNEIDSLTYQRDKTEIVIAGKEDKATANLTQDSLGVPRDYISKPELKEYDKLVAEVEQANKTISEKASQITPDSRLRDSNDAIMLLVRTLLELPSLIGYSLYRKDKLNMSKEKIAEIKATLEKLRGEITGDLQSQIDSATDPKVRQEKEELLHQVSITYDQAIAKCVF
jgi:hypothetical protein